MTKLPEFPPLIHTRTQEINATLQQIETLETELAHENYQIELIISNDQTLRNEQMRKAHRHDLQLNQRYQDIKSELVLAKQTLREETAQLELAQNQFTVAKIQAQLEIAKVKMLTA